MPRPRANDPSNLPARPRLAATPERRDALIAEFRKRLVFLEGNYRFSRQALKDDQIWFNDSLARLRRRVRSVRKAKTRGERVHPKIEIIVTHHARRLAMEEGCEVKQRHANEAAAFAVAELKSRRGRPENRALEHHVAGLLALIQNMSGKPVLARRYRNSIYDPHFAEGVSQVLPRVFQGIDPGITTTHLVSTVLKIRREYAGKELSFLELFPFYGATFVDGEMKLRPGLRLKAFQPNIPIYCP